MEFCFCLHSQTVLMEFRRLCNPLHDIKISNLGLLTYILGKGSLPHSTKLGMFEVSFNTGGPCRVWGCVPCDEDISAHPVSPPSYTDS